MFYPELSAVYPLASGFYPPFVQSLTGELRDKRCSTYSACGQPPTDHSGLLSSLYPRLEGGRALFDHITVHLLPGLGLAGSAQRSTNCPGFTRAVSATSDVFSVQTHLDIE